MGDDDTHEEEPPPSENGWSWVCQKCGGDGIEIRQRAVQFREGSGTANTPETCRACSGNGRIKAHR